MCGVATLISVWVDVGHGGWLWAGRRVRVWVVRVLVSVGGRVFGATPSFCRCVRVCTVGVGGGVGQSGVGGGCLW